MLWVCPTSNCGRELISEGKIPALTTEEYINESVGSILRLRNDLYCVEWGVKLYSLTPTSCSLPVFV